MTPSLLNEAFLASYNHDYSLERFFCDPVNTYVPVFRDLDAHGVRKQRTHTHIHTHTHTHTHTHIVMDTVHWPPLDSDTGRNHSRCIDRSGRGRWSCWKKHDLNVSLIISCH